MLEEKSKTKSPVKAAAFFDKILDIFAVFSAICVIFLALLICYAIAMRYVFHRPITGINEIAEYCLIFFALLVAGWVLKKEGHIPIDIMLELLKPKAKALTNAATSIICAIASLVITWYGVSLTYEYFVENVRLTTYLMPPAYLIIFIIPLSFFLLAIQFLRRAYRYLKLPIQAEKPAEITEQKVKSE